MASTHTVTFSSLPSIDARFPFSLASLSSSPPLSPPRCLATISFDPLRRSATATTILSTGGQFISQRSCIFSSNPVGMFLGTRSNVSCAVSMADGQVGDPGKVNLDHLIDKARKYWDKLPQPVKSFPWNKVMENFIQLVFGLTLAVIKCLSVPLLAITSLSELSYCAHERKLRLVPAPLIIGFAVTGIMNETALQLSPVLKDADVPWHLMAIAIFLLLLKLPGPYYPYWGRIFIPHFANGGLLRILWFAYLWYREPQQAIILRRLQSIPVLLHMMLQS
ncbi:hypothetical protein Ancab_029777 [Ancistrocladus abbreviatus]